MRRSLRVVSLIGFVLFLVVPAAPAVAAGRTTYCAVLISKELDSRGVSKTLQTSCSTTSELAAKNGLDSVAASTLLMRWYRGAGYTDIQTQIYGSSGGCDGAGYRVEPNSYWKVNLSSIIGENGCNRIRLYNIALTQSGAYYLPISNIGYYNDNVGLTQVYNFS